METKSEMVDLAKQLNPVVGYWDPLKLADRNFWNQDEEVCTGPPMLDSLPMHRDPHASGSSPSAGCASRS